MPSLTSSRSDISSLWSSDARSAAAQPVANKALFLRQVHSSRGIKSSIARSCLPESGGAFRGQLSVVLLSPCKADRTISDFVGLTAFSLSCTLLREDMYRTIDDVDRVEERCAIHSATETGCAGIGGSIPCSIAQFTPSVRSSWILPPHSLSPAFR